MKFKVLFVIFNIVLLFSFLTVFLLPFFILDSGFMLDFWSKNWYFGFIFLGILGIVNCAFIMNWKMLSFLEQEDWPALSRYLEGEVLDKKHLSRRKVQLLCDSLLLLGDFPTVNRLESLLSAEKPRLLGSLGVRFASAHLLAGNYESMHDLARSHADDPGADSDWLRFFEGFALHMQKRYAEACDVLLPLSPVARDPLVVALSGYLSGELLARVVPARSAELAATGDAAKKRLTLKYNRDKWERFVEEEKAGVHVVILSKLTGELSPWLFGSSASRA
jgi:hypothetical protein